MRKLLLTFICNIANQSKFKNYTFPCYPTWTFNKVNDAFQAAHANGIIHRDIKPDNIMISHEGYVKAMDFGLAKLKQADRPVQSATEPQIAYLSVDDHSPYLIINLYGTNAYMSPEQIERLALDERTDIFFLLVWFCMK